MEPINKVPPLQLEKVKEKNHSGTLIVSRRLVREDFRSVQHLLSMNKTKVNFSSISPSRAKSLDDIQFSSVHALGSEQNKYQSDDSHRTSRKQRVRTPRVRRSTKDRLTPRFEKSFETVVYKSFDPLLFVKFDGEGRLILSSTEKFDDEGRLVLMPSAEGSLVFREWFINSSQTEEGQDGLFYALSNPLCSGVTVNEAAQAIIKVVSDETVIKVTKIDLWQFLMKMNHVLINREFEGEKGTIYRTNSLATNLINLALSPSFQPHFTIVLKNVRKFMRHKTRKNVVTLLSRDVNELEEKQKETVRNVLEEALDQLLWDAYTNSQDILPAIEQICRDLFLKAKEQYQDSDKGYEQVKEIYFLRFFCPDITSMESFKGLNEERIKRLEDGLKALSKVLQLTVNGLDETNKVKVSEFMWSIFEGKSYERRRKIIDRILSNIVNVVDAYAPL